MTPLWKIALILFLSYLIAQNAMRTGRKSDELRKEIGHEEFDRRARRAAVAAIALVFGGLWLWGVLAKWWWP